MLIGGANLSVADRQKLRTPWAALPDFATKHQLCLIGWPSDIDSIPGPGFNVKKKLTAPVLARLVAARRREEEEEGKDEACIRIISWTDGKGPCLLVTHA